MPTDEPAREVGFMVIPLAAKAQKKNDGMCLACLGACVSNVVSKTESGLDVTVIQYAVPLCVLVIAGGKAVKREAETNVCMVSSPAEHCNLHVQ